MELKGLLGEIISKGREELIKHHAWRILEEKAHGLARGISPHWSAYWALVELGATHFQVSQEAIMDLMIGPSITALNKAAKNYIEQERAKLDKNIIWLQSVRVPSEYTPDRVEKQGVIV